jgi:hypothetical protein
MRKTTVATLFVIVVLGLGGVLFFMNPFNPSRAIVQDLSERFMEDVQFKDFRQSSLYHHELERDRVDVGQSIEMLFMVKPEFLDLMEYRIVNAEVDSTGDRARVKVRTRYEILNKGDGPKDGEILLYWIRRHPNCPLGAECPSGTCIDEFGETLMKFEESKSPEIDRADERKGDDSKEDDKPSQKAEKVEVPMTCDGQAEKEWYMNLDSTFKTKKYNY